MMRFADPYFFILLFLLIPAFLLARHSGGRIKYSNIKIFKNLSSQMRFHPRMLLTVLRVMVLSCFIVALARPQAGKVFSETSSDGVDILLAVDTSGSMQAMDFKLNGEPQDRLSVVKNVVKDFIKKRTNDRIGLIVFGEEAFVQCPLTLDHGILMEFLKEVQLGMAGDATAIGSAIGVGVSRIKDLEAKSKVIILLTDGRNTAGRIQPDKATEIARSFGVKIYTIGVGTRGKAPFLVNSIFGKRYVYRDVDIDEKTLQSIATNTNAKYFRATDTAELEKIYAEIDALEKTEKKIKEYTEYKETFHWALIPGILFLLLELGLANTKLRKIP